jgi:hypothetical protein
MQNTNLTKTTEIINDLHQAIQDGDSGLSREELDDLLVRARVLRQIFANEELT